MIITHPTELNWFYEAFAKRVERELTLLGHHVTRVPAVELSAGSGSESRILIVNLLESLTAAKKCGRSDAFLNAVRTFRDRILVNYDSVRSHWFINQLRYEPGLITHVIDVNIASQEAEYRDSVPFYWLPETLEEPVRLYAGRRTSQDRPLPWCVLGHAAKPRATLIHALMKTCGTGGFAYVPPLRPFGEHSGLDEERLHRVIGASDMVVWNSYHSYPYHEGLRALHAVAAGAAPAKIDPKFYRRFVGIPWVYDGVEAVARRRRELGTDAMWRQALDFFRDRPSLGASLDGILNTL